MKMAIQHITTHFVVDGHIIRNSKKWSKKDDLSFSQKEWNGGERNVGEGGRMFFVG